MRTVQRSALVAYTNHQMYELVADVPSYKEFLPWCSESSQIDQADGTTLATVQISLAGLRNGFTTRNMYHPYTRIELELERGPFKSLSGEWLFSPKGEHGSEVKLMLTYDFSSGLLSAAVSPMFDKISDSMVDAFVQRAKDIY